MNFNMWVIRYHGMSPLIFLSLENGSNDLDFLSRLYSVYHECYCGDSGLCYVLAKITDCFVVILVG